jgi:hypothetical protein
MQVIFQSAKPLNKAGFKTSTQFSYDSDPFISVEATLNKINKYRGPAEQILHVYSDPECKSEVKHTSWVFFNSKLYVDESSFGSA